MSSFLSKQSVISSLYHQPVYIEQVLSTKNNIKNFNIILIKNKKDIIAIYPFYVVYENFDLKLGLVDLISVPMRKLRIFGNNFAFDNSCDFIDFNSYFKDALDRYADHYDIGFLEAVPVGSTLISHFSCANNNVRIDPIAKNPDNVWLLEFPESWDEYIGAMRYKTRYNLNCRVKKITCTFDGHVRLQRYREVVDVEPFLFVLNDIYQHTWQAHAFGCFCRNSEEDRAKNVALAELGALDCFALYVSGEAIAYLRGYQHKGIYYYEEIGYKKSWRKFAPGSVLNMLMLPILFSDGNIKTLDFGYGDNDYKQIFGNKFYSAHNIFLVKKWSLGAILSRLQHYLQSFYVKIRNLLLMLKMDKKIRFFLKGKKNVNHI
ncbi:GNAT family N-acetyltransferase [uncultured Desulfobulbus sp.]|uniref:GNAT family N-acetyltransferase n=1 Tax=uncultured Desulfobulbus sp. TaxID=239745 RepID=UPI0029C920B8|nr:GNAT family N-acetyltransferase [uncultured Desulfobulbus sp.]